MDDSQLARRAERRETFRRSMRRFYRHMIAATLIPGLGLVHTRARRVGWLLFALFLAGLSAVGYVLLRNGFLHTVLAFGVSARRLLTLMILIVAAALVWIVSIVFTARATMPRPLGGLDLRVVQATALLCCVIVAVPATLATIALAQQRSLVGAIFAGPDRAGGPNAGADDPWAGVGRVNLLLLGSDAGVDRIGTRTDSMMVASIDPETGQTVLFGIPRNLEKVPFPESNPLHQVWPDGFGPCPGPSGAEECLLNAVWTQADTVHPELFVGVDNPGLVTTRDVIGEVLGLRIDYTTVIDLSGFEQLVDAMGGVDLNVRERVCVNCKSVNGQVVFTDGREQYIEPGYQHLDGTLALWYARSRAQSDDFNRMRRQRCVVGALIDQVNPVRMLANYGQLASVLKENVSVDIPQSDLDAWVVLVERIQRGGIRSLPLTDQNIDVTDPDFDQIRQMVQDAISPVPATPTPTPTTPSDTSTTPTESTTAPSDSESTPSESTSTTQEDVVSSLTATC